MLVTNMCIAILDKKESPRKMRQYFHFITGEENLIQQQRK